MRFGCLQVVDDGEEYIQVIDAKIIAIEEEKANFLQSIQEGVLTRSDWYGWNGEKQVITPAYVYSPVNFEVYCNSVRVCEFDEAILKKNKEKKVKHYKCECRKCGKIRYYTSDTLKTEPNVCFKPMYRSPKSACTEISTNKRKNVNNESVRIVHDRNAVVPNDEYCDSWNKKREKDLAKREEEKAKIVAALPRMYAKNYYVDYTGMNYESFEVLECVNEKLESDPYSYFNQRHQKKYRDITVYKQYRCKCYLCGKEKLVTCDKFGIYPPTEYGPRAYYGYWSEIFCDCHKISSFQWIVNDILIKHGIEYQVEVAADGLYGIDNETPLRFDFAVYNNGELVAFIECQGEQHYKPVEEFGGERSLAIQQRNDGEKRKYAIENNIKLIEISYKDKKYDKVESILLDNHVIST